jgi:hypothetical protein
MLAQLGKLHEAEDDYGEADRLMRQLIESGDRLREDYKVATRIGLGIGNLTVARAEMLDKQEDQEDQEDKAAKKDKDRQKLLEEAVSSYLAAAESARVYGQDVILETTVHKELGLAHALLRDWSAAEQDLRTAVDILERTRSSTEDQEAYQNHLAVLLEQMSRVHWEKAETLEGSEAFAEYEACYERAQEEIAILKKVTEESDGLANAYFNAGDGRLGMSQSSDEDVAPLLAEACENWEVALDMARHLGILDLVEDATARLEEHCGAGQTSEAGSP